MGELWGISGKYLGKIDRATASSNCTYFGISHGVIFNNTRYVIIIEGKWLVPISERDYSPYVSPWSGLLLVMMTSSNENIFRGTGHLCGEITSHWWIPAQRPVTRSFDVFIDLRLNKPLRKQWRGWWFDTPLHPLWRHCNVWCKYEHCISNTMSIFVLVYNKLWTICHDKEQSIY